MCPVGVFLVSDPSHLQGFPDRLVLKQNNLAIWGKGFGVSVWTLSLIILVVNRALCGMWTGVMRQVSFYAQQNMSFTGIGKKNYWNSSKLDAN